MIDLRRVATLGAALTLAGLCVLTHAEPAVAQAADPGDGPHATVTLVAETRDFAPGQVLHLGLKQKIEPGWHTYWINPGDSGLPTTIDWKLPQGVSAAALQWPAPERIAFGPLVSYGYQDEVLLPVDVTVPKSGTGQSVTLSGHASWLVCSDVCVPEESDVTLTLPATAGPTTPDPANAAALASARTRLPSGNPFATEAAYGKDQIQLRVATGDAGRLSRIVFFPSDDGVIDNDAAQIVSTGRDGVTLTLKRGELKSKPIAALNGVLAFHDDSTGGAGVDRAIAIGAPAHEGVLPAGAAGPASTGRIGATGLLEALLLAILGGIVLNLMPCVLPVLSIKALSLVRHARSSPREVRLQGLAYAAGVLVSFAAVAGALIGLRAAGAEIGWGFQLQSPIFLTIMIYVLFAVGLSLSGVFTVGDSIAGVGQGLAAKEGYGGSFFTGALATLVATPCTAPFMAAAIGFAITQPWYISFAVFEAIGVGLALPYLLLAFSPGARRFLPKPGAWMNRFKQVLAFPVYGTAVWLAFVLASEAGSIGITAALTGLVLIAFAAWLFETVRLGDGWPRLLGFGAATAAVLGAVALLTIPDETGATTVAGETAPGGTVIAGGVAWETFSEGKLAELRASGRPVFVDFTADWCITCKVNERVALSDPAVKQAFDNAGVVTLRGDWTRRDGAITHVLEANGRGGVPLYLYYPKGAEPVVLPQILTADTVLHGMQGG